MLSATHCHGLCMSSDFDQVYVILSSVACDHAHICAAWVAIHLHNVRVRKHG